MCSDAIVVLLGGPVNCSPDVMLGSGQSGNSIINLRAACGLQNNSKYHIDKNDGMQLHFNRRVGKGTLLRPPCVLHSAPQVVRLAVTLALRHAAASGAGAVEKALGSPIVRMHQDKAA